MDDNINELCINELCAASSNLEGWEELPVVNEASLPECPPYRFDPKDYSIVSDHSREEVDALGIEKFYISQIMGIQPTDEPPYELFKKEPFTLEGEDKEEFFDYLKKLMVLEDEGDDCDKVGIKFIGKLLNYYCPSNANFNLLPELSKNLMKSYFSWPNNERVVIKHAIEWSNCNYVGSK